MGFLPQAEPTARAALAARILILTGALSAGAGVEDGAFVAAGFAEAPGSCGILRMTRALPLSLFLEIHKVFPRKKAFARTQFLS